MKLCISFTFKYFHNHLNFIVHRLNELQALCIITAGSFTIVYLSISNSNSLNSISSSAAVNNISTSQVSQADINAAITNIMNITNSSSTNDLLLWKQSLTNLLKNASISYTNFSDILGNLNNLTNTINNNINIYNFLLTNTSDFITINTESIILEIIQSLTSSLTAQQVQNLYVILSQCNVDPSNFMTWVSTNTSVIDKVSIGLSQKILALNIETNPIKEFANQLLKLQSIIGSFTSFDSFSNSVLSQYTQYTSVQTQYNNVVSILNSNGINESSFLIQLNSIVTFFNNYFLSLFNINLNSNVKNYISNSSTFVGSNFSTWLNSNSQNLEKMQPGCTVLLSSVSSVSAVQIIENAYNNYNLQMNSIEQFVNLFIQIEPTTTYNSILSVAQSFLACFSNPDPISLLTNNYFQYFNGPIDQYIQGWNLTNLQNTFQSLSEINSLSNQISSSYTSYNPITLDNISSISPFLQLFQRTLPLTQVVSCLQSYDNTININNLSVIQNIVQQCNTYMINPFNPSLFSILFTLRSSIESQTNEPMEQVESDVITIIQNANNAIIPYNQIPLSRTNTASFGTFLNEFLLIMQSYNSIQSMESSAKNLIYNGDILSCLSNLNIIYSDLTAVNKYSTRNSLTNAIAGQISFFKWTTVSDALNTINTILLNIPSNINAYEFLTQFINHFVQFQNTLQYSISNISVNSNSTSIGNINLFNQTVYNADFTPLFFNQVQNTNQQTTLNSQVTSLKQLLSQWYQSGFQISDSNFWIMCYLITQYLNFISEINFIISSLQSGIFFPNNSNGAENNIQTYIDLYSNDTIFASLLNNWNSYVSQLKNDFPPGTIQSNNFNFQNMTLAICAIFKGYQIFGQIASFAAAKLLPQVTNLSDILVSFFTDKNSAFSISNSGNNVILTINKNGTSPSQIQFTPCSFSINSPYVYTFYPNASGYFTEYAGFELQTSQVANCNISPFSSPNPYSLSFSYILDLINSYMQEIAN